MSKVVEAGRELPYLENNNMYFNLGWIIGLLSLDVTGDGSREPGRGQIRKGSVGH